MPQQSENGELRHLSGSLNSAQKRNSLRSQIERPIGVFKRVFIGEKKAFFRNSFTEKEKQEINSLHSQSKLL
jgi:hypothetical protein